MYNGIEEVNELSGKLEHVKYSLQAGAQKLAISKKLLDDYLLVIRHAKKHDFNFIKYQDKEIGVLR